MITTQRGAGLARSRPEERQRALRYLHSTGLAVHWDMIRVALASVADTVIVPLQDVLGLGTTARMNLPGTSAAELAVALTAPAVTRKPQ